MRVTHFRRFEQITLSKQGILTNKNKISKTLYAVNKNNDIKNGTIDFKGYISIVKHTFFSQAKREF